MSEQHVTTGYTPVLYNHELGGWQEAYVISARTTRLMSAHGRKLTS